MTTLIDKFRPATLDEICGQAAVIASLKRFAANPYSEAFVFAGETGTGKTTAAIALAAAVGVQIEHGELGGVMQIASGEHNADVVKRLFDRLHYSTFSGSGWKVLIVNEADVMHRQVEALWLDRLECMPRQSVIVFTTNDLSSMSRRLRDRCRVHLFDSRADVLARPACEYAARIMSGLGRTPDTAMITAAVSASIVDGHLSFRRIARYFDDVA